MRGCKIDVRLFGHRRNPSPRAAKFKTQARRQFDDWSRWYDRSLLNYFLFTPAYLSVMREIARWRKGRWGPFDVLDIGCGTATLAHLILAGGWPARVVGLDYSPLMCLEAVRKNGTGGRRTIAIAGDSEHLPFADASIDVVTCVNSFHHYPNQQHVVGEMRRVVRPDGVVIVADGFRDNAIGWAMFDVVIAAIERNVHHASWSEMDRLFEIAGFSDRRRTKSNLLFPICTTAATV